MSSTKEFLQEINDESVVTRKMLERIPADRYDWQPHPKSMTIRQLAGHIAELPGWVSMAFNTSELNFAENTYMPPVWENNADLLELFEKNLQSAQSDLAQHNDDKLLPQWLLKHGDTVLANMTKGSLIRHAISQTIHHRAQLGVFLRLLDIPIPGTYGPSADDQNF
jgi:uncharacterized damage-inducible protein DinB